jgi:ketosteroid isomerase-like protein
MSQENVEIVRRSWELLNSRDWEALSELVDPDVVLLGTVGGLEEGTVSRGMDQVQQRLDAEDAEVWDEHRFEPAKFIDAGERVVVIQREYQRGKGSGVEVEIDTAAVVEVRAGRIVRMQGYMDPAAALEAVGLSEQDAHADS